MAIGKGWFARLRGDGGAPVTPVPAAVGLRFRREWEPEWRELEEQVDGSLKQIGSAVVSSWEVGAAEVARSLVGTADDREMIARYSDALVPTLDAFQALHKGCPTAFAEGLRAGIADGTLTAATRPLVLLFVGLDGRASAGWEKTVAYLEPLIVRCGNPDEVRAAFLAAPIGASAGRADGILRETLSRLPQAETLTDGVIEAFETTQHAITRDLEFALHAPTRALAAGLRR